MANQYDGTVTISLFFFLPNSWIHNPAAMSKHGGAHLGTTGKNQKGGGN